MSKGELEGRKVLVRLDLNLPMVGGKIADDRRVRAALPTLRMLANASARVVILSHFGRPGGVRDLEYSLKPVCRRLVRLLGRPVLFVEDSAPSAALAATADMAPGDVALLENTRFHAGESRNARELAEGWARLGDLMVNDAFGAAHRAHASTAGLATAVRGKGGQAVAGVLMTRELLFLVDALDDPLRPFTAVLGGAKIAGKVDVVDRLLAKVDRLLVGGAMANTFLAARGLKMGASLVEPARYELARRFMDRGGERIVLPVDCVVADRIREGAPSRVTPCDGVGPDEMAVDVGPRTAEIFRKWVRRSRTVVMNGPLGVLDLPNFARGTELVLEEMARACDKGALGILGGGDSAAAARTAGVSERLTHVSTGGGASLALLAGERLPGVETLDDADGEAQRREDAEEPRREPVWLGLTEDYAARGEAF